MTPWATGGNTNSGGPTSGGENSGVAKILKDTAGFLKEQRKITAVRDSYGGFVTAEFVPTLSN